MVGITSRIVIVIQPRLRLALSRIVEGVIGKRLVHRNAATIIACRAARRRKCQSTKMIVKESTIEVVVSGIVNKAEPPITVIIVILVSNAPADVEIRRLHAGVIAKRSGVRANGNLFELSPSAILKVTCIG